MTVFPDLRPDVMNVHAIVTTKWGNSSYRPLAIPQLESYYVDTALDNDADTWSCDIGDPTGEFMEMFERNSEVRCQLFGVGTEGQSYIMTGLADEISYDEEGTLTLTGRDLSSLATDSIVRPMQFRHVRAWSIVDEQAKGLGFRQTQLARVGQTQKVQYTDGSESYWEFWYRLYRKEKMWLWCEPSGILIANRLNYESGVNYYLGMPKDSDSEYVKRMYIPVERAEIRKSTQSRVAEVWVYGHRGDNGFLSISKDPTMQGWIKRPRKIMLDTDSHTAKGAQKLGWEEIFEGKVGSTELTLTIPDPGFMVRQNRIAHVRLPEIGFEGEFFVVGVRLQGGPNGFLQEIRLREKQYAISRRVPDDPKRVNTEPRAAAATTALGQGVSGLADMPESWGTYFVKAAKEFHGPWDFRLYLATLLGICQQETNFSNERELGGPGGNYEWYPPPSAVNAPSPTSPTVPGTGNPLTPGLQVPPNHAANPLELWRTRFANEKDDGYVDKAYGVGPMQLTDVGLKHQADDHYKVGNRNEFQGGRWHPEHNIWIAAKYLRDCLQGTVRDSGRDIDMWMGVMAYNRGIAGALSYFATNGKISAYAISVKNMVYNTPGYLQGIQGAVQASQEAAKAAKDGETDIPSATQQSLPGGLPTRNQIMVRYNEFFKPAAFFGDSQISTREAIVMAAMWGYYNKEQMHYSQGSGRMSDFAPPPNVPGHTDCSGFATWCYKSAKAPDPNNRNYDGQGYTGTLWSTGKQISYAQIRPGDLVFYGDPNSTASHVAVFAGHNSVVSFGSEQGPYVLPVKYRSDLHGFATYPV